MYSMNDDLFAGQGNPYQPLAARMRPRRLAEFIGQEHLLGPGKALREALEKGLLHSMIFWGPPGVGKTTLARMIADMSDARFETIAAVLGGVTEIRQAVSGAQQARQVSGRRAIRVGGGVHRGHEARPDAVYAHLVVGT